MPDWTNLIARFDFDNWANKQWLGTLQRKSGVETDLAVFSHLLSASEIWIRRCNGTSVSSFPVIEPTEAEIDRLTAEWKQRLNDAGDDPIIAYKRTTGEALEARLSHIAAHLLNHGTYHRGELRGLCRARGDSDFPETDLILWMMTTHPPQF